MVEDKYSLAERLKVCIYGAGAVGGSIAVRLSQVNDVDVCVIARGSQERGIQASELTVVAGPQRITARLPCTETPAGLPTQDIVIVSVKSQQLNVVAEGLPPLLRLDPHGKLRRIADAAGKAHVRNEISKRDSLNQNGSVLSQ